MDSKIKLAVVDDQHLVREGLIALLKEFDDLEVVMEASNGRELLEQLQHHQPHVILLDFDMPVMGGIETTELVKKSYPDIKIIIVTMYSEEELMIHLMERGANGFMQKDQHISMLIDAIHAVQSNNYYFNDHISMAMLKRLANIKKSTAVHDPVALTEREIEIVKLICKELSNKEIAEKLYLSHRTIDSYREKLMQKIGAKNTAGIVIYAVKHNLIEPNDLAS